MEKNNNFKIKLKDFANGTSSAVLIILFVVAIIQFYCITTPEATAGEWHLQIYRLAKSTTNMSKYIFSVNMMEGIFMALCGAILAGIQGSFAFRKSKCSAILSKGIGRKAVFNSRIYPSIIGLCLTVIVPKLYAYHANIESDGFSLELLRFCVADFLALMTTGLFVYTVVTVCCFITKHWLDAVFTSGAILFFGSITKSLVSDLLHTTLYGGGRVGINFVDSTNLLDPMQVTASLLTQEVSYEFAKENTVYFLIAGSVIMLIACFVALHFTKKHFCTTFKAENIGRLSDNKTAIMFNKITVGLLGASIAVSGVYQYFEPFFNNTVVIIMALSGAACGLVFILLCNLLTADRFHFSKKDLIPLVTTCSAIVLCLVVGATNIFGLYDKVPDAEEVESVTVSIPFDGFVPTPEIDTGFTTADVFNTIELELTDKESIKLATTIHSAAVSDKTPEFAGNVYLKYTLKNGTNIIRQYNHVSESAYDCAMALWDTAEVKEFYKRVLFPPEGIQNTLDKGSVINTPEGAVFMGNSREGYIGDNSKIVLVSKSHMKQPLQEITTAEHRKIREAIYKDICTLSYRDYFMPDSPQLGAIQIAYEYSMYSFFRDFNFYITDKCANTLKVLEELKLRDKLDLNYPIKSVYCVDTEDFLRERLPIVNAVNFNPATKKTLETLHVPYYDTEQNNYDFTPSVDLSRYNVTDATQWQGLVDSAYMGYYIKNEGKILAVEYEGFVRQYYVIPE